MAFVFPDRFFVTGVDTEAGKTIVSSMLVRGLDAFYWKPVQTGSRLVSDSDMVRQMAGITENRIIPEVYSFAEPLSPHLAAALDSSYIYPEKIKSPDVFPLIVEGAGGLLVPLNNDFLMIDLIQKLNLPALIVARNKLGVINHTLLTIEALKTRSIDILGVILSDGINRDHKQAIERFSNVQVIAQLDSLESITPDMLRKKFDELFL